MKIKKRETVLKDKPDTKLSRILNKRLRLPTNIRLGIIGLIFLLLIFSTFNATAVDEQPEVEIKTDVIYTYIQNGVFDYTIYLKNNTVYNNKPSIKSHENLIAFRNIVDHIEASFSYSFTSSKTASITGDYTITAKLNTDMWNKQYNLASGRFTNSFNKKFPIDYLFYENVTERINTETGVSAADPILLIECSIYNIKLISDEESINLENFNPTISLPLNTKIIDISDTLKFSIPGDKTNREEIITSASSEGKEQWTANSLIFVIIILIFSLVTRNDVKKLNETEKQVKKINKKYNEWIVEIDKSPKRPLGAEIINMRSIDDLIKISEELGKPVIYHESEDDGTHSYYVLDENVFYKFALYDKEKFIKYFVRETKEKNQIF